MFSLFLLGRNPKLVDVPNLANVLKFISELKPKKPSNISDLEQCTTVPYCNVDQPKVLDLVFKKIEFETVKSILKQDLNCLPDSETESDDDQIEHSESDAKTEILKKKRRTQSAGLSLEDLSKYFAVPIVEASRKLNVGVTVLKRKCREFGIPRWPYRMVKSIDSLIHDLQEEEAEKQQENNKAAAIVAAEKQKKLETEMRNIVERPFMEIQIDIKRFRQDSYNKRRRASRAKKNQESLATSSST